MSAVSNNPDNLPISVSAGGVVLRFDGNEWLIALEQQPARSSEVDSWCLPKGHIEPGEDLETAARREVAEEVGVTEIISSQYVTMKERVSLDKKTWKQLHYFLFTTNQVDLKPQATDKIHVGKWFILSEKLSLIFAEQVEVVEEVCQIISLSSMRTGKQI